MAIRCPVCGEKIEEGQEVANIVYGVAGYRVRNVPDVVPKSSEIVHEKCIRDYPD